jgi:hypothetical protein
LRDVDGRTLTQRPAVAVLARSIDAWTASTYDAVARVTLELFFGA